jgi:hypothetical protein
MSGRSDVWSLDVIKLSRTWSAARNAERGTQRNQVERRSSGATIDRAT